MEQALSTTREHDAPYSYDHDVDVYTAEPLGEQDVAWISRLANRSVTLDELASVNTVLDTGSKHLIDSVDLDTVDSVVRARKQLFEALLGWDDDTHPLHRSYVSFSDARPRTMPLGTVVSTLRTYSELGLDAPKVINAHPVVLGLNPDSVRQKYDNLVERGLNASKVINALPVVLGLNPDSVRQKYDNLIELGLDAPKVINALPAVLSLNLESVRQKYDNLIELGLDAPKVINAHPAVLSYNPDSVRMKIQLLDRYDVFSKYPELTHSSFITSILMLPLESLVATLPRLSTERYPQLADDARVFMKSQGATNGPERKDYLRAHRDELYEAVGCLAVRAARYAKTEDTTAPSWLEGEVIPTIPVRDTSSPHSTKATA